MENNQQLCCGCLCVDRRMSVLEDYWKKNLFLQIIREIPITEDQHTPISLCWECNALIARFTKFKRQVIQSFQIFQNFMKQDLDLALIKQTSKLQTYKVHNLAILPHGTESAEGDRHAFETVNEWTDVNKLEAEVKEEDNTSVFSNGDADEEEKALIELVNRRKLKSRRLKGNLKKRKRNNESEVLVVYKEIKLSSVELEEERRLMSARDEYVNAMFRCEKCIASFPNADDLKDHIKFKHELNASNYKCRVCECSFASEVSYNYHTNRHTRRFQCVMCEERFGSKNAASKHYSLVHCHSVEFNYEPDKTFECEPERPAEDGQVTNSIEETPSFPCELCTKTFRWKTSLRKHLETHRIETGQKRKPYCESCRLSFMTTSNLQKHVKTSSKHQIQLKLRKLGESGGEEGAGAGAEGQQARIEQIKWSVNSARQQFACPQCGKRFQWRGNLLRHLHSHAARANGDLVCEPCKRTFSSIETYQQHMKISKKHVSEDDFKYMCSDCGKKFANKTRLKDHVDWEHLKNYVHKCAVCQKVFKSHTSLYLHKQVVHKKDHAEHLCDHCGKSFPNQAKLRGHVAALHSREAPYRCGTCAARFSWHSCLSRHVRRVHRRRDAAQH